MTLCAFPLDYSFCRESIHAPAWFAIYQESRSYLQANPVMQDYILTTDALKADIPMVLIPALPCGSCLSCARVLAFGQSFAPSLLSSARSVPSSDCSTAPLSPDFTSFPRFRTTSSLFQSTPASCAYVCLHARSNSKPITHCYPHSASRRIGRYEVSSKSFWPHHNAS